MKACIVARSAHQADWGGAFAEGLRKHGHTAEIRRDPSEADLAVFWGVRREHDIARQKMAGGQVCVLERGYLGDRFAWTSVSFGGGLNGHGQFRGPFADGSRWERHFAPLMRDWTERDRSAVIMGQVLTDMSLRGLDAKALWLGAASRLRPLGWDVRFRGHPLANGFGLPGIDSIGGSLSDVLAQAGLVVTINSNAGVDAVLAGVPTISFDDRSMAWAVTGHETEDIIRPDRTAWAHAMAWKQWSLEEMRSGECWAAVGEA